MILVPAKFEKLDPLKTKKNLVFSVSIDTESPDFEGLKGSEGYLAFNPDLYRAEMLEIIKAKRIDVDASDLTPSQRLRMVLYNIYTERNPGVSFEDFYKDTLENIINHYQTKYL